MGAWGYGVFDSDSALDSVSEFEAETGIAELDIWEDDCSFSYDKENLESEQITAIKEHLKKNHDSAINFIQTNDYDDNIFAAGALCLMYNVKLDESSLSKVLKAVKAEFEQSDTYVDTEERKRRLKPLIELLENYDPEREVTFSTEGLLENIFNKMSQG